MTTRRGFLAGIIAAGMAPAIAKSGILMPVKQILTLDDLVFQRFSEEMIYTGNKNTIGHPARGDNVINVGRGLVSPIYTIDTAPFMKDGLPQYVASPLRGYPGRSFLL